MGRPRRRNNGRGVPFTGEPNGLQPGDDVGNRRSFKQTQVPPDNIGNRRDLEEEAWVPNDDVGNRVDAAPTHEISGVLAELGGRRRRKKGGTQERMGRYIVGGVNPVVAGNVQRAVEAQREADDKRQLERDAHRAQNIANQGGQAGGGVVAGPGAQQQQPLANGVDEEGRRGRRRRRRRRDGREQVDGQAAQEVSERRAQRFFDFEEDDRFEYVLKSPSEQKRKDAHEAVASVLKGAGRDAVVQSRVLDDENRPKVIITIDEKGPAKGLPEERRTAGSADPLFVLGNAALMSLNYLANKIVNRYPDDRIRLAILPAADEKLYLESLEEHRRQQRETGAEKVPANGASGKAEPAPAARVQAEIAPAAPAGDDVKASETAEVEEAVEAVEPAEETKPKRRAAKGKKTVATKAAAQSDDTGADASEVAAEADPEPAAEAAAAETSGRKATKKKASAKVRSRTKPAADEEEAPAVKKVAAKASTKKAVAKKTAAKKKSATKKRASSEG